MAKKLVCFMIVLLIVGIFVFPLSSSLIAVKGKNSYQKVEEETKGEHLTDQENINLFIIFGLRNKDTLNSASYTSKIFREGEKHAVSKAQFKENHSPKEEDYEKIISLLESHNLIVVQTSDNRLLLELSGSKKDIEKTFDTQISVYKSNNRTLYKSEKKIDVPDWLSELGVLAIDIDGSPVDHYVSQFSDNVSPNAIASNASPVDLKEAYGVNDAIPNDATGAGTTIGIVVAYGNPTIETDLESFNVLYSLPDCDLQIVGPGGVQPTGDSWDMETALDVEWAHAMAPDATIILHQTADASMGTMVAALNSFVQMQSPPSIISLSWGINETDTTAQAWHDSVIVAATSRGIQVYAATGDDGAYNNNNVPTVSYPASDPDVIAVGGTELYYNLVDGKKQYYEYAWGGSGGGYSTIFDEPDYQSSAGISNPNQKRGIPDISLEASPGVTIIVGGVTEYGIGGTSLSTPVMAGFSALALGGLNSVCWTFSHNMFYNIYSSDNRNTKYIGAFHDIYLYDQFLGNENNGFYHVTTGWDAVTGLGSINLCNFLTLNLQSGGIVLTSESLSTGNIQPGQSFQLNFEIENPSSFYPLTQIGLGASIRHHGSTSEIYDSTNDICGLVPGGTNIKTRDFTGTSNLLPGWYDVNWAIWMGQPGFGNVLSSSGWLSNQIEVLGNPSSISLTANPNPIYYGSGSTLSGIISSAVSGDKSGTVYIQYSTNNINWNNAGTTSSDSTGQYSYWWEPPSSGTFYVRSYWNGNSNYGGATSSSVTLTVISPGGNLVDNALCIGIQGTFPNTLPITRTSTFFIDEDDAHTWVKFSNVNSGDEIRWFFYDPYGSPAGNINHHITGSYSLYAASFPLYISDSQSYYQDKIGLPFQIRIFYNDDLMVTQTYTVLKYASSITAYLSYSTITYGQSVMVSGQISPSVSDGTMTLQYSSDGNTWNNIASGTPFNGYYSEVWSPPAAITYSIRAVWTGDNIYYESTSTTKILVVSKASTSLTTSLSETSITEGDNVDITGTLSPTIEGRLIQIQYSFNNVDWFYLDSGTTNPAGQYTKSWSPTAGTYYIRSIWSGDNNYFGATSSSEPLTVIPSNIPPTASIDSINPNPAIQGESVSFVGSGVDPEGSDVDFNWFSSRDGFLSSASSFATSDLSIGTHTITLVVTDEEGAESSPALATLRVDPPPIATIVSISPNPADQYQPVYFSAHEGDEEIIYDTYEWASSIDGFLSSDISFSTSELSAGTHTISLVVTLHGIESDPDMDSLIINPGPPTIYIRADGSIEPSSAPIDRTGDTFTLTADILESRGIVIERDNIVFEGANHVIQGGGYLPPVGVKLDAVNNVQIKNLEISYFYYGVELLNSTDCVVAGCILTNNDAGVFLNGEIDENNLIHNNEITSYGNAGIMASGHAVNCTISNNRINDCEYGLGFGYQSHTLVNTTIMNNQISNCEYGIAIEAYSFINTNNKIFHNNFYINTTGTCNRAAYVYLSNSTWDDGYPSGGNYWSDYTGVDGDGDGIGDTPYVIDDNNQDNYPLVNPWTEANTEGNDWPMFSHDIQNTGYSTFTAPVTNNTRWSYITPGSSVNSPSVADGKVYIGSSDYNIYCLDASTGIQIWNYSTDDVVRATPAIADGKVYVGSDDLQVYCLNASTGIKIWNYTVFSGPHSSFSSSPAVHKGKVYIGFDKLYCLNASTGTKIWDYSAGGYATHSSPAIFEERVYTEFMNGTLYCLNASNGDFLWSYTTTSGDCSPAIANGKVYTTSNDGKVCCLNALDGTPVWDVPLGGFGLTCPAVAYDRLYIGSIDQLVWCMNASTGELHWSYETSSSIHSSPALTDGRVYIGSDKIYCLDAFVGQPLWTYTTGIYIDSSPALAYGNVYIGSDRVYCFGSPIPTVHNLDTSLDYFTIQAAIDASETLNGHTIFVEEGTYNEILFVNKSLLIIGENKNTTIIKNDSDLIIDNNIDLILENCSYFQTGNIYITENSTLKLKNAEVVMNMTQDWQYNIYLYNSGHLIAENSLIVIPQSTIGIFDIILCDESSAILKDSILGGIWGARGYVCLEIQQESEVNLSMDNCTLYYLRSWSNSSTLDISNSSDITCLSLWWTNCGLSISNIQSGFIENWNSYQNVSATGQTSNLTILDSTIRIWSEMFFTQCNATISDSEINSIHCYTNSNVTITNVTSSWVHAIQASNVILQNITNLPYLAAWGGETAITTFNLTLNTLWANYFNGTILFGNTNISNIRTIDSEFFVQGNITWNSEILEWSNSNITRNYSVSVKNEIDDSVIGAELQVLNGSDVIWSSLSNSEGLANFNITFNDANYTKSLLLKATNENYFGEMNLSILSSTPMVLELLPMSVHNLNTGLNYYTIQSAIDAPETLNGHTIYVDAGTYYENVVVTKSISLIGENNSNTIIDGSGFYEGVVIANVNNVVISRFCIQNVIDGIYIYNSSNNTVSGNYITNSIMHGIYLDGTSNNNIISDNNITNSGWNCIYIINSIGNTVSENTITNSSAADGINIADSSDNIVSRNTIANCSRHGICLSNSSNNTLSINNITNNENGIELSASSSTTVNYNTVTSNTFDGISLASSNYNTISENNATANGYRGIILYSGSNNNTVERNLVSQNGNNIMLFESDQNAIIENEIVNCSAGLSLKDSSSLNYVYGNSILSNEYGIWLYSAIDNTITANSFENNEYGILTWNSLGNRAFHNDFVDNVYQVFGGNNTNIWDDGYPSGGNYWSDYMGVDGDGDGIGDTPYVIDDNNQDNYPLVVPYSESDVEWSISLNATLETFDDVSVFGVANLATDGFDVDFDQVDPIAPPMGVVSYFYYPDNPVSPVNLQKLSTSKIGSGPIMNWTYKIMPVSVGGTMGLSWNQSEVDLVPEEYSVLLQLSNDTVIDMRSVDEFVFVAESDVTYVFSVLVSKVYDSSFEVLVDEENVSVNVATNSTILNFGYNQTSQEFSFDVSGFDGTEGVCNMTVPKSVGSAFVVYVDGEPIEFVQSENATHYFLYFSYTHSTHTITVAVGVDFVLELNVGWNMVSFPSVPEDSSFSSIFSDVAFYQVLTWDGSSYTTPTIAEAGVGYWVLVLEDTNITISNAQPVSSYEAELVAGWNMIGSIYGDTVNAADVFPGYYQLLTWNGSSYVSSTTIEPEKGYWALVLETTTINVSSSP